MIGGVTPLSFYVGCLVFGGLFIGASLLGGEHQGDHDHALDKDHGHGSKLPFLSVRFWTFAIAFFGLAGTALTAAGGMAAAAVAAVAAGVGLGAGYTASRLLTALAKKPVGLLGGAEAHVGREGALLLPVARGQRGKVRLQIGGVSTDLIAETDGDEPLPAGATVLVLELRGSVAVVERSPAALPPRPQETP